MKPRILVLDIETAPTIAYLWSLHDEHLGINQIVKDSHLLSFAAKWLGDSFMHYADQRHAKDIENDKALLDHLWMLLDEADIVIGHNMRQFDSKTINSRFLLNGHRPPSGYKVIDTLEIAKHKFKFISNKLEYLSHRLCTKYQKLKHKKFSGFELWKECLAGNPLAWKEMEKYNKIDVLSNEELYNKFQPWVQTFKPEVYTDEPTKRICPCGSTSFKKRGFRWTETGKFQRHQCTKCGAWRTSKLNEFSKEKRDSLRN